MNKKYLPYLVLALLVLVVKALQAWVDATPLFFLGDSENYIFSAIEGYYPIDRSFVYGWPIRWWGLNSGSIMGLMSAQILAGGITAWLLGAALLYFYRARFWVAGVMTIVFAFDPLQLLQERMVLAETFALLVFALQLVLMLSYLRQPRLLALAGVCALGLVVVSLRFMFIPVALALAVLVPAIRWIFLPSSLRRAQGWRSLAHLAVAVALTAWGHGAYRSHMGKIYGQPPAYNYYDGLILLAAWAPAVQPVDASTPHVAEVVQRQARDPVFPLADHALREAQLWVTSGLRDRLQTALNGDAVAANAEAKRMCRSMVRRDPGALVRIAWQTFMDYAFRWDRFTHQLSDDQGALRSPNAKLLAALRDRLAWEAAETHATPTLVKRYHLAAGPWYVFLFFSPLLWLAPFVNGSSFQRSSALLLFALTALLLAVLCGTAPAATYRYLHPFSFTGLLALGVLVDAVLAQRR
jgi:hypothetical protein